nr:acetyl esterase [Salmonella sp. NCTC 7297]
MLFTIMAVVSLAGGCHPRTINCGNWLTSADVGLLPYSTGLAPEHTFPAAHDDAASGANLGHKYAEQLGINRRRITLAGDSAGGHLALVTARLLLLVAALFIRTERFRW